MVNFISTVSINIPFKHTLMHRKQALHSMRQSGIFLSLVFTAADVNYLNGETSFLANLSKVYLFSLETKIFTHDSVRFLVKLSISPIKGSGIIFWGD